jgi:hypothetical protein
MRGDEGERDVDNDDESLTFIALYSMCQSQASVAAALSGIVPAQQAVAVDDPSSPQPVASPGIAVVPPVGDASSSAVVDAAVDAAVESAAAAAADVGVRSTQTIVSSSFNRRRRDPMPLTPAQVQQGQEWDERARVLMNETVSHTHMISMRTE